MNLHDGGGGEVSRNRRLPILEGSTLAVLKKMDYKECSSVVQNIKMTIVLGLYVVTTEKNLQSFEVV